MFMKRITPVALALFAFFCSGFVTESYINKVLAEATNVTSNSEAEKKVKEMYPKFMEIVNLGAKDSEIMDFAKNNMDKSTISKHFCGAENDRVFEAIVNFLTWRLKGEAIQSVKEYKLGDTMRTTESGNKVKVECKLNGTGDPVNMIVIFSKSGNKLGKICEIMILGLPLVDGAKQPVQKYIDGENQDKKRIDLKKLAISERVNVICKALDEFTKSNARATSQQ